jgi:SAM-dependent methyltransferase
MSAHATELPHPGPRLAAYDGERQPYLDACLDVVAAMALPEHVLDLRRFLLEAERVLKPGGLQIHPAPNWAGRHVVVHAVGSVLPRHGRYWQYATRADVLAGSVRTIYWPVRARFGRRPVVLVWPRMRGGRIPFGRNDDDCVHVRCPPSLWRCFVKHQHWVIIYTAGAGLSSLTKSANRFAPAGAASDAVAARKNEAPTHNVALAGRGS